MYHFKLKEFIFSLTAIEHNVNNIPDFEEVENLRNLVINILEPARVFLKMRIFINSGFRCKLLNELVSGSKNSDHMNGNAADITCKNNEKLFNWIKDNCDFDQLIKYKTFIHVSYRSYGNRKEVLIK